MTPAESAARRNGQTRSGFELLGPECILHTFEPLNDACRSTGTRGEAPLSAKLPNRPAMVCWLRMREVANRSANP